MPEQQYTPSSSQAGSMGSTSSRSPGLVRSDSISSQTGSRESISSGGRDFLSSVSSELNGLAAQTTSMFTGLFGKTSSAYPFWNCFFNISIGRL